MKTAREVIQKVRLLSTYGVSLNECELAELAFPLARMLEKAIEGLGPCMCGYERGCDYCETMEKLDAIAAGKEDL